MAQEERVDLAGLLAGKHIIVDVDQLTIGTLLDLESDRVTMVVGAVDRIIVGGDLGELRALKPVEFVAVIDGLKGVLQPKKAS